MNIRRVNAARFVIRANSICCTPNQESIPAMARMGRPPLYNNCMDLDAMIQMYFDDMDEQDRPYTIAGIVYYLGFNDKDAVARYRDKPDFSGPLKRARLRIESQRSEQLLSSKGNPVGKIFDLKANFGWVDRVEVVGNTGVTVNIAIPEGPTQAHIIDAKPVNEAIEQQPDSCVDSAYVEVET